MCVCDFCKLHRRMKRTIANGSHRQKSALILELADLYFQADDDLNYERVVASGDWPTSVEIMEQRLEKAKAKRTLLTA